MDVNTEHVDSNSCLRDSSRPPSNFESPTLKPLYSPKLSPRLSPRLSPIKAAIASARVSPTFQSSVTPQQITPLSLSHVSSSEKPVYSIRILGPMELLVTSDCEDTYGILLKCTI